ncbi:hypothetical protein PROFUN_01058 [Planoprotostelium fungivorum]|uniref:Fe2OG dioxygenase domain-containing protein n=1 Tax=Planoprotostelium fungivorum TaxID=1890364 RepID=A0A2P6N4K7_9EUKA|nr:hypothetical protein PROFUN_01058 [Planoprotostelium fungivorum]
MQFTITARNEWRIQSIFSRSSLKRINRDRFQARNLHQVPILDATEFRGDSRDRFAKKVLEAFQTSGFLYLRNAPLSADGQNRAITATRHFFDSTEQSKRILHTTKDNPRGYYSYHGVAEGESPGGAEIEAFLMGNEIPAIQLRRKYFEDMGMEEKYWKPMTLQQKNVWPREDLTFREIMTSTFTTCTETSRLILSAIAIATGRDEEAILGVHSQADSTMEIKHYPPGGSRKTIREEYQSNISMTSNGSSSDIPLRVKAHSDLSSVTLLLQNEITGFEILRGDSTWVPLERVEGAVLVNTGDCMERWSGGKIRSTKHRVVANSDNEKKSRYSLVYFCMPNWDTSVNQWDHSMDNPDKFGDIVPFH